MTVEKTDQSSNYHDIALTNVAKLDEDTRKNVVHSKIIELIDNPVSILNRVAISKYYEEIIKYAQSEDICALLKYFFSDYDYLYESNNLHLLFKSLRYYSKIEDEIDSGFIESKINNFMNKLWDSYPQYLADPMKQNTLSSYLSVASGVYVNKDKKIEEITRHLDKNFQDRLQNLQKCFLDPIKIFKILKDKYMSNFAQYILCILSEKNANSFKEFSDKFIELESIFGINSEDNLPFFLTSSPHCMFVETFIKLIKEEDLIDKIVKEFILPYLDKISQSENCSYIIGVIISQTINIKVGSKVIKKLIKKDLIRQALVKKQHKFVQTLLDVIETVESKSSSKIFHNIIEQFVQENPDNNPDQLIRRLVAFKLEGTLPDITLGIDNVSVPGCLIAQKLLCLKVDQKHLEESIIGLNINRLNSWIQHPQLNHIIEVFLKSSSVGKISKISLIKSLKNKLVQNASNKYGSRVIDQAWKYLSQESVNDKEIRTQMMEMAEILSQEKAEYPSPIFFVAKHMRLDDFIKFPARWKSYHFGGGDEKKSFKRTFNNSSKKPSNPSSQNKKMKPDSNSSRKKFWKNKIKKENK